MEIPEPASPQSRYDYALGQIKSEVFAVHKRQDAQDKLLESIADDIKDIRQAPPRYPIIVGGILALGFVFTVVGLLVTPLAKSLEITHKDIAKHERLDGHSVMIKALNLIDKTHTDEHLEQEEDIGELRRDYRAIERRQDHVVERLARLETLSEERAVRLVSDLGNLKDRIDVRASDRWTGGQQDVFRRAIEQRLKELERDTRQREQ